MVNVVHKAEVICGHLDRVPLGERFLSFDEKGDTQNDQSGLCLTGLRKVPHQHDDFLRRNACCQEQGDPLGWKIASITLVVGVQFHHAPELKPASNQRLGSAIGVSSDQVGGCLSYHRAESERSR
jgi:hypothetical protein